MAELYELKVPGEIIGKVVIDSNAKIIGIVRSVRVKFPPLSIEIVLKGKDVEYSISGDDIQNIGNTIILKEKFDEFDPLEIEDIIQLRRELKEEIKTSLAL